LLKNMSLPQVVCTCNGTNQLCTKVFPYGKCPSWKISDKMKHFKPLENNSILVKPREYFEWITSLSASELQVFVSPFYEWMTVTIDGKIYAQKHPEQLRKYHDRNFPDNHLHLKPHVQQKRKVEEPTVEEPIEEGKEEDVCL